MSRLGIFVDRKTLASAEQLTATHPLPGCCGTDGP